MNILLCSVPFRPSIGGIETVSAVLAEQFTQRGHTVTVATLTPCDDEPAAPHAVVRRPDAARLRALMRAADVVFHNNISLQFAWPGLGLRKPWVVAHHTWIPHQGSGRLKHRVLPMARHIAVSHAIAASLAVPSTIIPNPYRDDVFRAVEGVARERDIAFVGRLVSDKGVPLLLQALALLRAQGLALQTTLVGDGPDAAALRTQAQQLGLGDSVHFAGALAPQELVRVLHGHRMLAVPSVWEEPFGVVVLEALACGCVPVVARSGGLPDAAGPCGVVFPKGDVPALAAALAALHRDPLRLQALKAGAAAHLAQHAPGRVAERYLEVLADACRHRDPRAA